MTYALLPITIYVTDLSSCLLSVLTSAEVPAFRGGRGE
jgi:hypothetical protein